MMSSVTLIDQEKIFWDVENILLETVGYLCDGRDGEAASHTDDTLHQDLASVWRAASVAEVCDDEE